MSLSPTTIRTTRRLSAAVAAGVVFDAVWVGAPFLVVMALPFAVVAWRYRGRTIAANVALTAFCALYVLVGVLFMLANGFNAPTEANQPTETISAGDFVFVYVGTPLALWLGTRAVRAIWQHRQAGLEPTAA